MSNQIVTTFRADEKDLIEAETRAEQSLRHVAHTAEEAGKAIHEHGEVSLRAAMHVTHIGHAIEGLSGNLAGISPGLASMGEGLGTAASAVGGLTYATTLATHVMGTLSSIMSGPLGWATLVAGVGFATYKLLSMKEATESTTEQIEKIEKTA